MESNKDNYQLLVDKLDQFIRKYYINLFIRGSLYSVGLILALFLGIAILEYYFYFPPPVRRMLFYTFLLVCGSALTYWMLLPLMHYFRLGKLISHEQAAQIIGSHFHDVKDKLLNILQLKQQADSAGQKDLIIASVNQKSEEIKLIPFKAAINLAQNRKYLRYALPPLLLLIVILFAAPTLIPDSANRLIYNNRAFERPAPFRFVVDESDLTAVQFSDFPLTVKVEGDQLPNEVFIDVDNYEYRLAKVAPNEFAYKFNNLQKEVVFRLYSSGVVSPKYKLNVLKKPNIMGFEVQLEYPAYIQRANETLNSTGDLVVPAGTKISWLFKALNTDDITLSFSSDETPQSAKRGVQDVFTYSMRALRDMTYRLYVSNKDLPRADSIGYSITVIPDLYPTIRAEKFQDSLDNRLLFFVGEASDDHGLLNLSFNYSVKSPGGRQGELQTVKLPKPSGKQVQFDHTFDLRRLELRPGDEVNYYFEVFDNDAVNGNKSTRTNLMIFALPTVEEYRAMAKENERQVKDELSKALKESRQIQEDLKKLREKLLQQKEMDWQTRKELEKLLERQKELEKQIEEARKAFEENRKNEEEFTERDQDIQEKQDQLEKLFEEVMNEELRELMRQIEDLMRELEKDQAIEMLENMRFSDEDLEKELDRLLELFKQLELEKDIRDAIKDLEKLAEEQQKLSEETQKGENDQQQLQDKQQQIDQQFQDLKEQMKDIQEKNQELERPKNIQERQEQMQDIQRDINDSKQQLQNQKNQKATQSQKNAAQKMKEMAQAMAMEMQSGDMDQLQEDMQALRQLLENLVGLSFNQEDLMEELAKTSINTPRYVALVQQQFKLQDDFRLIEDSLQALSKRVFQIESFINEKVSEIKGAMRNSIEDLEERRKLQATDQQQRSMKSVNDLALMLSEVMNQMQQQMSAMMAGQQMCTTPSDGQNDGRAPQDKITEGQQQLNEQMRQAKEARDKEGRGISSKEFAEMAAKQAALRKALREQQKKLQEQGKGNKELQDLIDEMDKIEIDLVNKRLTNEMLKRQQDILTRLLEHEKAEREREFEEKRRAETATQKERKMPPSLEEYIRKRRAEVDTYKSVSPSLKPYYKSLVEEYFKSLQSTSGGE
jgi:hypothetical protein